MGQDNEHKNFLITAIQKTTTHITPSIEMRTGRTIKKHNILEAHRISIVANEPNVFPDDPEENEVALKDEALWIYSRRTGMLDWHPLGGGGTVIGDNVPAANVVQDDDHNFVTNNQIQAIEEVVQGLIPAPKIVQDGDHQFMNQTQVDMVNDLIEGVEIDGGDLT